MPDQPADVLARARPKLMIEVAARGLPQNMVLDVDTATELHKVLGETIASVTAPPKKKAAPKRQRRGKKPVKKRP